MAKTRDEQIAHRTQRSNIDITPLQPIKTVGPEYFFMTQRVNEVTKKISIKDITDQLRVLWQTDIDNSNTGGPSEVSSKCFTIAMAIALGS